MTKIGLALETDKINYGSILQAYAMQSFLTEKGIESEVLDSRGFRLELNIKHLLFFINRLDEKGLAKAKWKQALKQFLVWINWKGLKKKTKLRSEKCREWIHTNIHFSPAFEDLRDLGEYCERFRAVVVGGGRLWLPHHIDAGFYTLEWVPKRVKRISFGTSLGVKELPDDIEPRLWDFISLFHRVSVREELGAGMLRSIAKTKAQVVCDPTMLLDAGQWRSMEAELSVVDEKYILCYFLGNNKASREYAKKLRDATGCKLVVLAHTEEYIAVDEKMADYCPFDMGPEQYLRLMDEAEYVVTDSLHAAIFSMLFHKQFAAFKRYDSDCRLSADVELESLLTRFGLADRLISNEDAMDCESIHEPIDFERLDAEIEEYKSCSEEFLLGSII